MLSNIDLVCGLLTHEGIAYKEITDLSIIMKACDGKLNPVNAKAVQPLNYDAILWDIYQTVDWIKACGLRRI